MGNRYLLWLTSPSEAIFYATGQTLRFTKVLAFGNTSSIGINFYGD